MKEVQIPIVLPRWYQDLSIPQMRNVFALGDIMRVDYAERVTGRTQRALGDIGVTSTFVKITAEQIKKIRRLTDLDPVKFLCEIYRIITGQSFDEEYKKVYDCNERIILSAIAFLTLPETVIELHRRIPMRNAPKLPPKPVPEKIPPRKRVVESPYLEQLFTRPYWQAYKEQLEIWRKQRQKIEIPRVILPLLEYSRIHVVPSADPLEKIEGENVENLETYQEEITDKKKDSSRVPRIGSETRVIQEEKTVDKPGEEKQSSNFSTFLVHQTELNPFEDDVENLFDYSKRKYTTKKAGFKSLKDNVDNRYGYSNRKYSTKKPWLGEKDIQLIITGSIVNEDSPDYPISLETGGIAYVTPDNSDESFFAALSYGDAIRKSYPRGRENLSRKWQEWLHNAEEDYKKVEREANTILSSVEKTLKLMGPEPACDSCCACRQARKANAKYHKIKTPHIVIDSVVLDGNRNKYVVGSLAMNSPAPSPSESTENLPEVIASHDKIIKQRIVNGVTDDMGVTTYYVSGVSNYVEHVPRKIVSYATLPDPIKNVPPCGCAIEKTINEGMTSVSSEDNISWTKNQQLCIGKKYRPQAGGASSCLEYPNDKSCRRNPFKNKVEEDLKAALKSKDNADNYPPEKKIMYSIADFRPCGDEDGMAVCGGPWGAVNIPDEEELARRAAEAKLILESPPCGDKPGRAICGAPFGSRHPIPKKPKKDDEDEEEDEEEVDEEELEERKRRDKEAKNKVPETKVEKHLNRGPGCSTISANNLKIHESRKNAAEPTERKLTMSKMRKLKKGKILKVNEKESENKYASKANMQHPPQSSLSLQSPVKTKNKRKEKDERDNEDTEISRKRKVKEIKNDWNKTKRSVAKFAPTPAILPQQTPIFCKREDRSNCYEDSIEDTAAGEESTQNEGPFGWRTKSEQELPPEKTLVYLVDPEEPMENIPVRIGGRPCKCRENRNAKKKLLYGVSGMSKDDKGKRDEITRVVDGLIYITPEPSVRNSDEYIPEYELYDSPYDQCERQGRDRNLEYIEKYLGPKSLMAKRTRASRPCCTKAKDHTINDAMTQETKQSDKELMRKNSVCESAEERWKRALADRGLMDFFSRCQDDVPCWLRCAEFSKNGCCTYPRTLVVKKPVCECKYERKIVKREEEKENWLRRQARLKSHKKLPCNQVAGLSRPMRTETNLVISDVKRFPRDDDTVDDVEYCVDGVTQSRVMGPAERILCGVGMHTPLTTPEPSKENFNVMKFHRHWSPTNIHDPAAFPTNVMTVMRADNKHKIDKKTAAEYSKGQTPRAADDHDKSLGKKPVLSKEAKETKKLTPASTTSQRFAVASRSLRATSGKKSSAKMLGERDKVSVHKEKSTGRILSGDEKPVSHDETKEISSKTDMKALLKTELEKMANEGFLFARLPACWQFPQLQWWLMYRSGFALPPEEKKRLMAQSLRIWNAAEKQNPKKVHASLFEVPQEVMDNWNFDEADKIKREIALKKATFLSNVRKLRVLQARSMWGLMEFGKFPGISFKKAYFTYQASKEADGFVFKPWENK